MIIYKGLAGEHISTSARQSIEKASRYNRRVRLKFNDFSMDVNKRLSVKHIVNTFEHWCEASRLRYRNSPAGRAAETAKRAKIEGNTTAISALMTNPPVDKIDAMKWLARFLPLADEVGVAVDVPLLLATLSGLGFVSGQHVGHPAFKDKTASLLMMAEYVAGQAMSMFESSGCCHPMIAEWASQTAGKHASQVTSQD